MADFIYLIHPFRHEFFENPTLEEETAMDEHFEYLKKGYPNGGSPVGWTLPG